MNKDYFRKLIFTLSLVSVLGFGCGSKVVCSEKSKHMHRYINRDNHTITYIISEKKHIGKLDRQDAYIVVNSNDLEAISKYRLYSIQDNYNYLVNITNQYKNKRQAYLYHYINPGNMYSMTIIQTSLT